MIWALDRSFLALCPQRHGNPSEPLVLVAHSQVCQLAPQAAGGLGLPFRFQEFSIQALLRRGNLNALLRWGREKGEKLASWPTVGKCPREFGTHLEIGATFCAGQLSWVAEPVVLPNL